MQALKTRTVTKATLFGGNKNKGTKGGKGKPAKRQAAPKRAATKRKVAPKPKRGMHDRFFYHEEHISDILPQNTS